MSIRPLEPELVKCRFRGGGAAFKIFGMPLREYDFLIKKYDFLNYYY